MEDAWASADHARAVRYAWRHESMITVCESDPRRKENRVLRSWPPQSYTDAVVFAGDILRIAARHREPLHSNASFSFVEKALRDRAPLFSLRPRHDLTLQSKHQNAAPLIVEAAEVDGGLYDTYHSMLALQTWRRPEAEP